MQEGIKYAGSIRSSKKPDPTKKANDKHNEESPDPPTDSASLSHDDHPIHSSFKLHSRRIKSFILASVSIQPPTLLYSRGWSIPNGSTYHTLDQR